MLEFFAWQDVRRVCGIRGDHHKKRFSVLLLFVDPAHRLREEQIRAVSLCFHYGIVVQQGRIDVVISREISTGTGITLSNATGTVNAEFIKAAFVRSIRSFVTQVPFAKDAVRVAH